MDVNATWALLAQAVEEDEWDSAAEHAEAILAWMSRDGFAPTITKKPKFDAIVARIAAKAIREWEVLD